MSWAKQWFNVLLGSCLLLLALPAGAQSESGFELQQLRPNPDVYRGGLVSVNAAVLAHGEWRANVLFNYARNPLILYNHLDERVSGAVTGQATLHVLGSVGLWDVLEVGLDLPLVVYQAGDSLPDVVGAPPILHSAGVGDLRLVPKAQLLSFRSEGLGAQFTAAAAVDLFLPTGDGAGLRGSDLRIGPRVAFDATFSGGQRFGTNLGYLHRTPRQFGDLRIADAVGWSVFGETPVGNTLSLTGEVFGQLGDAGEGRLHTPMEALLGAKTTALGVNVLGAVGMGIGRSYGTPTWRALLSLQFPLERWAAKPQVTPLAEAPAPVEQPKVEPVREEPPAVVVAPPEPVREEPPVVAVAPEPPPKPVEPPPEPTQSKVRIDRGQRKLELADSVHFKTASAEIAPKSFPLLNEVAALILAHPEIKQLSIEGHTDNQGGRKYNLKLSRARAQSLVRYMISRGVEASRLSASGFGPDRPVATNKTAAGRAKNRRVDFRIAEITLPDDPPPQQ
jgi:outer membrane protein OmpA-like peptidoglycan-associated protein